MYKHLYDIFKLWYRAGMVHSGSIYFYSDPHFGDEESFEFRKKMGNLPEGIQNIKDLDEYQIKMINKMCNKYDTFICLGDVGDIEGIRRLKAGRKILVLGNHDKGASNYKRKIVEIEHNSDTCPKCGGKVVYDRDTAYYCGYEYAWCNNCGTVKPKDDVEEDNHLFDEVYEGVLIIGEKLIISHEPVIWPFGINIHGHIHCPPAPETDPLHVNVCAEHIKYTPICINMIIKSGALGDIDDIHRVTIDKAIEEKRGEKNEDGQIDY